MIISSAVVPPAIPGSPASASAPATGGTDEAPSSAFALLLPAESGCDANASSDEAKSEPDDTADDGKPDEAEPVQAEQTSLAALLYALPATVVLPPVSTSPQGSNVQEKPAGNVEAPTDPTGGSSTSIQETHPANRGSIAEPAPFAGASPRRSEPVIAGFRAKSTAPNHGDTKTNGTNNFDALNRVSGEATGAQSKPQPPTALTESAPAILPNAGVAVVAGLSQDALPVTSLAPAPKIGASSPTAEQGVIAPPFQDLTMARGPVDRGPKHSQSEAAEIAAPPSTEAVAPKNTPAISSPVPVATSAPESASLISELSAEADVSLLPEPKATGKGSRGTGGAKPLRNMIEVSTIHPDSSPDAHPARSAAASLTTPAVASGKGLSGRRQDDPQDQTLGGRSEANQAGPESFSLATAPSSALASQRSEANVRTMESKPVTTAAVIEELGHGLERIQQQGHNRVDLRLSLEGGGEVSIELQVRDGAVHASFLTGSAELREALQQGWSQLAGRSEHLGISLAEPIFKAPATGSSNAGQQDFREHRQQARQEQNDRTPAFYGVPHQPRRPGSSAAPIRPHTTSALNTWA